MSHKLRLYNLLNGGLENLSFEGLLVVEFVLASHELILDLTDT